MASLSRMLNPVIFCDKGFPFPLSIIFLDLIHIIGDISLLDHAFRSLWTPLSLRCLGCRILLASDEHCQLSLVEILIQDELHTFRGSEIDPERLLLLFFSGGHSRCNCDIDDIGGVIRAIDVSLIECSPWHNFKEAILESGWLGERSGTSFSL
ncbi:hypothetical protein DL95DRAFT_384478, partial [Leptodontidium sp. 2 PMI_412]